MEIRIATELEKQAIDQANYPEWGAKLTLPQYQEREHRLRSHPWAVESMNTWVLWVDGAIGSSCETFRMRARANQTEGSLYCFASVFTPPEERGKGYASALLREVIEELERADALCLGTILYSDVKPAIYERLGFVARPATSWRAVAAGNEVASLKRVSWEDSMRAWPRGETPEEGISIARPWAELDWHWHRARAYASLLGCELSDTVGFLGPAGDLSLWYADFKTDVLQLLAASRLAASEQIGAHGQDALALAREMGLSAVEAWASDTPGLVWPTYAEIEREDAIPMIRLSERGKMAGGDASGWGLISRSNWA